MYKKNPMKHGISPAMFGYSLGWPLFETGTMFHSVHQPSPLERLVACQHQVRQVCKGILQREQGLARLGAADPNMICMCSREFVCFDQHSLNCHGYQQSVVFPDIGG